MRFLKLKSTSIEYEDVNPSNITYTDYVLIFMHEALGSIRQFKSFPYNLCNELGVSGIVYNRQGHGNSSPLQENRTAFYLHDYAYDELHELIHLLCPTKKIILVGHSDGGTISLLHASKSIHQIVACISIAAHVINEEITKNGIIQAIEAYNAGKFKKLEMYHFQQTDELIKAWYETWLSPDFADWNICSEIRAIKCPVLAIQGDDDQYGSDLQLQLIKQNISNCIIEKVACCGHHPHLEKETELIKMISDWTNIYLTNSHSFSVDSDARN